MRKYIRSERANLFEPNVYIGMLVKLSGVVTSSEIEQAVYAAYEANEATMSQIVLEEKGDAYYRKMEKSGCRFFLENRPFLEVLSQSEKSPFALKEGELVRTFLIKEDERLLLLIHAHHLVGDGKSVLILLEDILRSLDKHPLTYKPMVSVNRSYLEKRARLYAGTKWYIKGINQKWKRNGKAFTWEDYYAIHQKYWQEYTSDIEWKTFDIKGLTADCSPDITINSYMITKLLESSQGGKVVGIPVSIRETSGMSNQTSGIAVKYRYKAGKTFEENAVRVHRAIYKKLNNRSMKYFILLFMERLCPSLIDAVLLQSHGCYQHKLSEKLAQVMGYTGAGGRDLGVTNLNKIDITREHEKFTVEEILFVPPKVSYAKQVVGISTYAERLTVCYHRMKRKG